MTPEMKLAWEAMRDLALAKLKEAEQPKETLENLAEWMELPFEQIDTIREKKIAAILRLCDKRRNCLVHGNVQITTLGDEIDRILEGGA